jgi:hypothetical protein
MFRDRKQPELARSKKKSIYRQGFRVKPWNVTNVGSVVALQFEADYH